MTLVRWAESEGLTRCELKRPSFGCLINVSERVVGGKGCWAISFNSLLTMQHVLLSDEWNLIDPTSNVKLT